MIFECYRSCLIRRKMAWGRNGKKLLGDVMGRGRNGKGTQWEGDVMGNLYRGRNGKGA